MVFGNDCPVVAKKFNVPLANINHGFDSKYHAGFQYDPSASFSVVKYLWFFMKIQANAVSTIFSDNWTRVLF